MNGEPQNLTRRVLHTSLAALGVLFLGNPSFAQPPPFDPDPPPTFDSPEGDPTTQPPPGEQPWPQPGTPPQPGMQPGMGGPPPAGPGFGGNVTFGGNAGFGAPPPPAATSQDEEDELRAMDLAEQISLNGSVGLLRTAYAGSSVSQMFRVAFMTDFFSSGGFLCNSETPCDDAATEDDHSHVGAFFGLNATPLSFLEAYVGIRTYANSNNLGSPGLLQVLGDTTLGIKAFTPFRIGNNLTIGGDIRLLILNGAGDVGPSGAGTSAEFLALATSDFRKIKGKGVGAPLRVHLNMGYRVDNSGELVADVEALRAERDPDRSGGLPRIPVSRIERYGLGINRVDFFQLRLGVDVPYRWIQPFIEYNVDIPVNRQGYECHTRTISQGDVCLALADPQLSDPNFGGIGYSGIPSRLTIGARTNPLWDAFRGLSAMFAVDIGLSATSTFIEEVAPQAPWTIYFGLGYAFDTKVKKPQVIQPPPPPPQPIQLPPPPEYYVRGQIIEKGTQQGVANAIISVEGSADPPVASSADGRFLSRQVQPGTLNLTVTAPGYKPGTCQVTVNPAMGPGMGQPDMGQPGMMPGQPGMMPGQPGMMPGQPGMGPGMGPGPGMQPPPTGPQFTDTQCELEALPKDGGVKGSAKSSEGTSVAGVTIELIDAQGNKHNATSGPDGSFSFGTLPLGTAKITAKHPDYMLQMQDMEVRANEQVNVVLTLNKRPDRPSVKIVGKQIQILKQIHFELNSAVIKGESMGLIQEIADVLHTNSDIKKVEIQGHTDNTGPAAVNRQLSQDRADAVRQALIQNGIAGDRMEAKGYGAARPLAPNVTPANRARNRRVQFFIIERS